MADEIERRLNADAVAAWPTSAQYSEAVQNLPASMTDPELRGGQVMRSAIGMPLLYSGGFADVYPVHCPATGATWAVKFFTRGPANLRARYQAISDALARANLPFIAEFKYLPEGARIDGRLYPVVKMRWIEGLSLNRFVAQSLDQPRTLQKLLALWIRLAKLLDQACIAHADLQHGNVLLVPRGDGTLQLRLIDYDGMFVPTLAGKPAAEVGLAAYQHPRRQQENTFDATVDRFSHLAICCAVRCLMEGGRLLWERYDNGENLLFRGSDYQAPGASPLFRELWMLRHPEARTLVGRLALAAQRPLEQTPLVSDLIRNGQVVALTAAEQQEVEALFRSGRPSEVASRDAGAHGAETRVLDKASGPGTHPGVPVVSAVPIVDAELVVESDRPPPRRQLAHVLWYGVTATVRGADRALAKAAGEGNELLHNFLRVIATTVLAVGVPALVFWIGGAVSTFWQTQWERRVAAVRVEQERAESDAAEQQAESARRSAESAFQAAPRPARLRTALSKLEQGRAAREDEDFREATLLFRQAADEFGTAVRDAGRYKTLGELDRQIETLLQELGLQPLEARETEIILAVSVKRSLARQALDARDWNFAEAKYREILDDLQKVVGETERAQLRRIVGTRGEQFETALRDHDRPAAERLWNEFRNFVVSDSDRAVWDRQRARWRKAYEELVDTPRIPVERRPTFVETADIVDASCGIRLKRVSAGKLPVAEEDEPSTPPDLILTNEWVTRDFHLGIHEVTEKQFFEVMGVKPVSPLGDDYPVDLIAARQAEEFCRRLTERDRDSRTIPATKEYRLPTEVQWEYAARAGTTSRWFHGDDAAELSRYAWHAGDLPGGLQRVGGRESNPWGFYDMLGNAAEWTATPVRIHSEGPAMVVDPRLLGTPRGPGLPNGTVVTWTWRGGRYLDGAEGCRVDARSLGSSGDGTSGVGFRVALVDSDEPTFQLSSFELANGLKLVRIRPGEFHMGTPGGAYEEETPSHDVRISRYFYLGETEVTQAQYREVLGINPSARMGHDLPVESVSWLDAVTFVEALNEREGKAGRLPTGLVFSLPTEAQWEYAARAGGRSRPWVIEGDSTAQEGAAWFNQNANNGIHPVRQLASNRWGLFDLAGNVSEWVLDAGDRKAYQRPGRAGASDPYIDPGTVDVSNGELRVHRGGSYQDVVEDVRLARRYFGNSSLSTGMIGFRLALVEIAGDPRRNRR